MKMREYCKLLVAWLEEEPPYISALESSEVLRIAKETEHELSMRLFNDLIQRNWHSEEKANPENLAPFKSFLAERWLRIQNTNLAYPHFLESPWTSICHKMAIFLKDFYPERSIYQLLMPTITVLEDIAGLPIDELSLKEFVLSDDNSMLINVIDCMDTAMNNGEFFHTGMVTGAAEKIIVDHTIISLSPGNGMTSKSKIPYLIQHEEKDLKISFYQKKGFDSKTIAEFTKELRYQNTHPEPKRGAREIILSTGINEVQTKMIVKSHKSKASSRQHFIARSLIPIPIFEEKSVLDFEEKKSVTEITLKISHVMDPGQKYLSQTEQWRVSNHSTPAANLAALISKIIRFKQYSQEIEPTLNRLIEGLRGGAVGRGGQEFNASNIANEAIFTFHTYLNNLSENEKNQLMRLTAEGLSDTFANLWGRLARPKDTLFTRSIYCVKLIAASMEKIKEDNQFLLGDQDKLAREEALEIKSAYEPASLQDLAILSGYPNEIDYKELLTQNLQIVNHIYSWLKDNAGASTPRFQNVCILLQDPGVWKNILDQLSSKEMNSLLMMEDSAGYTGFDLVLQCMQDVENVLRLLDTLTVNQTFDLLSSKKYPKDKERGFTSLSLISKVCKQKDILMRLFTPLSGKQVFALLTQMNLSLPNLLSVCNCITDSDVLLLLFGKLTQENTFELFSRMTSSLTGFMIICSLMRDSATLKILFKPLDSDQLNKLLVIKGGANLAPGFSEIFKFIKDPSLIKILLDKIPHQDLPNHLLSQDKFGLMGFEYVCRYLSDPPLLKSIVDQITPEMLNEYLSDHPSKQVPPFITLCSTLKDSDSLRSLLRIIYPEKLLENFSRQLSEGISGFEFACKYIEDPESLKILFDKLRPEQLFHYLSQIKNNGTQVFIEVLKNIKSPLALKSLLDRIPSETWRVYLATQEVLQEYPVFDSLCQSNNKEALKIVFQQLSTDALNELLLQTINQYYGFTSLQRYISDSDCARLVFEKLEPKQLLNLLLRNDPNQITGLAGIFHEQAPRIFRENFTTKEVINAIIARLPQIIFPVARKLLSSRRRRQETGVHIKELNTMMDFLKHPKTSTRKKPKELLDFLRKVIPDTTQLIAFHDCHSFVQKAKETSISTYGPMHPNTEGFYHLAIRLDLLVYSGVDHKKQTKLKKSFYNNCLRLTNLSLCSVEDSYKIAQFLMEHYPSDEKAKILIVRHLKNAKNYPPAHDLIASQEEKSEMAEPQLVILSESLKKYTATLEAESKKFFGKRNQSLSDIKKLVKMLETPDSNDLNLFLNQMITSPKTIKTIEKDLTLNLLIKSIHQLKSDTEKMESISDHLEEKTALVFVKPRR